MKITSVNVTVANQGKLRAYVVIVINDGLVIHGLRIIEGESGLFVSMPSGKQQDETFIDVAYPSNRETRELIERSVLTEYERLIGNSTRSV
jgi:stage V sporulation protein G